MLVLSIFASFLKEKRLIYIHWLNFCIFLSAGAPGLLTYDPLTHGTPLNLLQIPQAALQDISTKLGDNESSTCRFRQDNKTMADLKFAVSEKDFQCTEDNDVEVGFVCRKCHLVFPAENLCAAHQTSLCFAGALVERQKTMLTLVQMQYKCGACRESFTTQQDFLFHCASDSHRPLAEEACSSSKQASDNASTSSMLTAGSSIDAFPSSSFALTATNGLS